MQKANVWLQGIQYFRAIAVLEIIVLHVTGLVGFTDLTVLSLQKVLIFTFAGFTSFAVPHFIFISGVVLYNKYNEGFSLSTFYKKRFSSVLPPYLVWSTFYYFYPLVILTLYSALLPNRWFGPTSYGSGLNLSGYVAGLAVGVGHLWFILLIMQFYLLYPLLARMYNRFCKKPIYVLSLLLLVQVAFSSLLLTTAPNAFQVVFLSGIFYFVFGFFIAEHYETLKQKVTRVSLKSISLVVVLATICYAVIFYHIPWVSNAASAVISPWTWLYQILGPFYCLLLIIFYLRISLGLGEPNRLFARYLEKIGEDSFGIYLTLFVFLTAFTFVLIRVGVNYDNLLFYPTLALLVLISSYWSVQVLYHLPFSAIVVGKPRKKQRRSTEGQNKASFAD
jgi:peptidoglycan/LPS O-acetylase OafA/YrhL